ncbi:hypothetical protein OIV83_003490 [Microbotryomycetes sp. JL201]|nr:hypothetical protein OIV83_003490 [Microbotryomycetes sp. JL201]
MDDFIATKLQQLGLRDDEETCSFVTGIVQEDSFEPEALRLYPQDKKFAILSMLEAEDDETTSTSVEQLLEEAGILRAQQLEQERIQDEERQAQARGKETPAAPTNIVLTPEQEAARRAELVKTYGFVEEEDEQAKLQQAAESEDPTTSLLSGDKPFVDPRYLSRKQKKKAEQGVDILMQPNLNAAIVKMAEQQKRKEAAAGAAAKKDKDKADMKKQKEDAAKKLAEKQKKAQRQERRA